MLNVNVLGEYQMKRQSKQLIVKSLIIWNKRYDLSMLLISEYLNVSETTVRGWMKYSVIPSDVHCERISELINYSGDEIKELIQDNRNKTWSIFH